MACVMYPLHVELSRLSLIVQKVAVDPALVNPVQLSLEVIEVCLAERPRRRDGQLVELVPYGHQDSIRWLERLRYLSFPRVEC